MTDAEWATVEPFMPAVKRLGRPRKVDLRGVVEGLLYIPRTACPWRLLAHDFPNRSTVQRYFYAWQTDGLWERINSSCFSRPASGRPEKRALGRGDRQPVGQNYRERRPARVRRWQEGQRAQGPHHHRHQRAPGRRLGARRRHPGSRRRGRRAGVDPLSLPLAAPRLRRWRLCWRKAGNDPRRDGAVDACHRQATR